MQQLIVLFCLLSSALATSILWSGSDPEKDVLVSWTSTSSSITFTVRANTTGWIGIGFSPSGSMAGADIIIGWVDSGAGYVKDCFANANGVPSLDESQDITLLEYSEESGATTLVFRRALDTGNTDSDRAITDDTTRLLVALGNSDPASDSGFAAGDYHAVRGVRSVYLLEPASDPIVLPDDIQTFEMRASNKTIPHDVDTLYWCTFHKLPTLQQKNHIVQINPLIEHLDHVHHMIAYGCFGLTADEIIEAGLADPHECNGANMPELGAKCIDITFGWAIGGSGSNYPVEAGYPIGPDSDQPDYIMLEIHYDNPDLLQGKMDNSGLELVYTPTLRPYDAAMLTIGTVAGIVVPPGDEDFVVSGFCSGNCTHDFIQPSEGINVFAYNLHTHLLGSAIQINQYRDGKLLRVIGYDNYYDFNYQAERVVREPISILPGDTLEIRCTMKATDRTDVTYGGLSTRDEMCLGFLTYYPKQNAAPCNSFPELLFNPFAEVYTKLGVSASRFPFTPYSVNVPQAIGGVPWNGETYKTLQDAYDYQPYYQRCTQNGGDAYPSHLGMISPPKRVSDGTTGSTGGISLQCTLLTFISFLLLLV